MFRPPLTVCIWPCGACVSAVTALLPFLSMEFVSISFALAFCPLIVEVLQINSKFVSDILFFGIYVIVTGTNLGCEPTFVLPTEHNSPPIHNIFCDNGILLRTILMSLIISCIMWTVVPSFANYVIHCLPLTAQWTHYSCQNLTQLCTRLECMTIWTYPIFLLMSKTKLIV
jgi:hypothetical protein